MNINTTFPSLSVGTGSRGTDEMPHLAGLPCAGLQCMQRRSEQSLELQPCPGSPELCRQWHRCSRGCLRAMRSSACKSRDRDRALPSCSSAVPQPGGSPRHQDTPEELGSAEPSWQLLTHVGFSQVQEALIGKDGQMCLVLDQDFGRSIYFKFYLRILLDISACPFSPSVPP